MNILQRIAVRLLFGTGPYEAANASSRRGSIPGAAPQDAKFDLTASVRSELVRRSRYLVKNSGFFRELVGNMALYAVGDGIRPQALSPDPEWNRAAEEHFQRWSRRADITGRFNFSECQHLACRALDTDGEIFVHRVLDDRELPKLQLIEAHRIGDDGEDETIDGVKLDPVGRPVAYRLLDDEGGFDDLEAAFVLHVFEPDSPSQVRGAPTLQHSINHLLDEMELLALEKHAVKDNADVSRVLKTNRTDTDDTGDFQIQGATAATEPSDPVTLQRIIGGKMVRLNPEENLESFQSNRPSPTFTGFLEHLRRDSALGMIPFEFAADSSKVGGAGVRLVVAKADRRFSRRQTVLIERMIRPTWMFVIGHAIRTGKLPPVEDWTRVTFTTPRRITVDAGREAQQNRADVEMGLKTLAEHFAELGMDFSEEMEIRAQNAKALLALAEKYEVPLELLYRPSGGLASLTPQPPA